MDLFVTSSMIDAFYLGRFCIFNSISLVLLNFVCFFYLCLRMYWHKGHYILFPFHSQMYFQLCFLCHIKYCLLLPCLCFLDQPWQRFVNFIYLFKEPAWLCWYSHHILHCISLGFPFSFYYFLPYLLCFFCSLYII